MKAGAALEHTFASLQIRVAPSTLRVLAGLLDLAVPAGIAAGICAVAGIPDVDAFPPRYWNYLDYFVDVINTTPMLVLAPVVVFCAVYVVVNTLFTALIGNTPLSRLIGIRAQNRKGSKPGFVRSFVWTVFGLAFGIFGFIGPLWTIVDPKRRMLHDILSGVVVASARFRDDSGDPAGPDGRKT